MDDNRRTTALIASAGLLLSASVILWTFAAGDPIGSAKPYTRGDAVQQEGTPAATQVVAQVSTPDLARDSVQPHLGFTVVVRDQSGQALTGVVVSRGDNPKYVVDEHFQLTLTDANGVAAVEPEAIRGCRDVVVSAHGYLPSRIESPTPGSLHEVTLELGTCLTVHVVDLEGKPQKGVRLGYSSSMLGGFGSAEKSLAPAYSRLGPSVLEARSDDKGRAVFRGILPGFCSVWSVDPLVALTAESSRQVSRILVPTDGRTGGEATVVIDRPLIAFWHYLAGECIDHGSQWTATGRRKSGIERHLMRLVPGSIAVAIGGGGESGSVPDLQVEALLSTGAIVRHVVPFVALTGSPSPLEVPGGQDGVLGRLKVTVNHQWCDTEFLGLHCTRLPKDDRTRLLRRLRIVDGEVALPPGRYEIGSDSGMLEEPTQVEVLPGSGPVLASVACRQDVAVANIRGVGRSGRSIKTMAMLYGSGTRRGLTLSTDRPSRIAVVPGDYRVSTVTGYETKMETPFTVATDAVCREVSITVTIDDG